MAERTRVTIETLTDDLNRIMAGAEADAQWAAAKGAVDTKAKLHGHMIDRKESGQPGDFAGLTSISEVEDLVRNELGNEAADALVAALSKQDAAETAAETAAVPAIELERGSEDTLN